MNFPPLSVLSTNVSIQVDGLTAERRDEEPAAQYWVIGPRYFETSRVPILAGRGFDDRDDDASPGAVIVSTGRARRFWPGQGPIGKRLQPLFPAASHYWLPRSRSQWLTVVGVSGDVRLDGVSQNPLPQTYLSCAQFPTAILHLLVRTNGNPARLTEPIRRELAALDRDEPVFDVKSLEEVLAESTIRPRLLTRLLDMFAGIAIALTILGIYGTTACWASRRTREIGIRIALGARPVQVIWLVAGQSLPVVLGGTGAGIVGGLLAARVLRTFLAGVNTADLLTFASAPLGLALAAAAATHLPARRAAGIRWRRCDTNSVARATDDCCTMSYSCRSARMGSTWLALSAGI